MAVFAFIVYGIYVRQLEVQQEFNRFLCHAVTTTCRHIMQEGVSPVVRLVHVSSGFEKLFEDFRGVVRTG